MSLIPKRTLSIINPMGGSYIDGKWVPGTNFKSLPKSLSDLLKSKSLILWTPFNEDNHKIGYTPNVVDEGDATINMIPLNTMGINEGIINGDLVLQEGETGLTGATTTPDLKITGDITIIFWYKALTTLPFGTGLFSHGISGESQDDNILYSAYIGPTKKIKIWHEYGAGIDVDLDTGLYWPDDNEYHMLMIRRNTALKWYEVSLDNGAVIQISYLTNPDGGVNGKLWIGGDITIFSGSFPDFFIFDELLTNSEIDTIYNAGQSQNDWFNYVNWDNIGSGYVSWLIADSFSIQATVQPLTAREMLMLPEGRRTNEAYKLYTTSFLKTVEENLENPSAVKIESEYFETFSRATWKNNIIPHYKYIIIKAKQC